MRLSGRFAFIGLLLASSLLMGCTGEGTEDSTATPTPASGATATSQPETGETPVATPTAPSGAETENVYRIGISADLTTTNHWAYLGPDGTVWNGYVLTAEASRRSTRYSAQRYDWVPSLAADFPTPLEEVEVEGETFWTTEVELLEGVKWSDGSDVTAEDFAFTANTAVEMQLTGNWPSIVDPEFFDHAESRRPVPAQDLLQAEAGPGAMAVRAGVHAHLLQGLLGAGGGRGPAGRRHHRAAEGAVLPRSRWEPSAGASSSTSGSGAPSQRRTEPGLLLQRDGSHAVRQRRILQPPPPGSTSSRPTVNPAAKRCWSTWKAPSRQAPSTPSTAARTPAVLALKKGDIDFMLNPLGLSKGLQEQLAGEDGLTTIENASDGVRYLGFNFRRAPMDNKAFRQAVATLIDKEFLVDTVLQGVAIPIYTMVPEGNGAWYNADVPLIGKGLTRQERVGRAVELLKEAGFTWETEPRVSEDGNFIEQQGEGLRMPNGEPVPAMEVLAPSAGYDPLRSTFAIWIERWLSEVGIPVAGQPHRVQRHRREGVRPAGLRHVDPRLGPQSFPGLPRVVLPQPSFGDWKATTPADTTTRTSTDWPTDC